RRDRRRRSRHALHAGPFGGDARADLVAHGLDGLGRRADERDPHPGDGPGEVGVLRVEAVPRVDAVGAAALDGAEDGVGVEVALRRRLTAEGKGLVSEENVEGVTVEVGVPRPRADAELAARPDDPHRDLAPVGDQDLVEHWMPMLVPWAAVPPLTTRRGRSRGWPRRARRTTIWPPR